MGEQGYVWKRTGNGQFEVSAQIKEVGSTMRLSAIGLYLSCCSDLPLCLSFNHILYWSQFAFHTDLRDVSLRLLEQRVAAERTQMVVLLVVRLRQDQLPQPILLLVDRFASRVLELLHQLALVPMEATLVNYRVPTNCLGSKTSCKP